MSEIHFKTNTQIEKNKRNLYTGFGSNGVNKKNQ